MRMRGAAFVANRRTCSTMIQEEIGLCRFSNVGLRRESKMCEKSCYAPAGIRSSSTAAVRSAASACWVSADNLAPWLVR